MPASEPRTFDVSALVVDGQNVFVAAGTAVEILSDTSRHGWAIACAVAPTTTFDDVVHEVTVRMADGFEIRGPAVLTLSRSDSRHATVHVRFDYESGPTEHLPVRGHT
jgi:hypothetical protein